VMTGSSARKLKRGQANLLAGRAFSYDLYPLTVDELGSQFNLNEVLQYGSLPGVYQLKTIEEKNQFLRSYVRTYIKEEIQMEQIVRKVDPFRNFLPAVAQCNGKILNYSKLSRDLGVDDKTIRNYFSILEDTLLGFHLPGFHRSIRKQQTMAPKFYLFDTGVKRAMDLTLNVPLMPGTYAFGEAFEHWVILEEGRKNHYFKKDYKFSYLRTKDGLEIDLVVERPGQPDLLVEIKSTDQVTRDDLGSLLRIIKDWDRPVEAEIWSRDPKPKVIEGVRCLPV
jgi:uncharacterized protein